MERHLMFGGAYSGKRVLVTGHTGFKGSWLCSWLISLGAEVAGYSLDVPSTPSNFEICGLPQRMRSHMGDVRDYAALQKVFDEFRPEIVFHLAAQALVRKSYHEPVFTFETNVMGTLNVLEAVRRTPGVKAAVIITSDKCYRNVGWTWGYRETDALGGEDPYSASKGAAELVAYSYMESFFRSAGLPVAVARAGNVIGGGDWALDRIIPDCVRSWTKNEAVRIRYPHATRPWQHVLEPLSGYLLLGARLAESDSAAMWEAFNFGPDAKVNRSVLELISVMNKYWDNASWEVEAVPPSAMKEATLLKLCCDKALNALAWHATLDFEETVRFTAEWYRNYAHDGATGMFDMTRRQIDEYCAIAKERGLGWAHA